MRTITLLFSALVLGTTAHAQTAATFDDLFLPTSDTFYVNISSSGNDVGFYDGLGFFPCVYDTSGGYTSWNYFSYSNMKDSVTSGYTNSYSAKTAIGYNGSAQYAVAYCANPANYLDNRAGLALTGAAVNKSVTGFYVTNSTYAYNSMRDGDFVGKKFGGTTGNDPDWFLLTVYGYTGGVRNADSVNFYLADYRFAHNDSDYIVKTWDWVNLLPLGHVDSVVFRLSSSDTGSFGMNTPAYFCMDNFTTDENSTAVNNAPQHLRAKIYPNPVNDVLYVEVADNTVQQITVTDVAGKAISAYTVTQKQTEINTSSLQAGMYILQLAGCGKTTAAKFIKK